MQGVAHTAVAAKPPQASPAVAVPASPGSSEVEAEEESEKGVKAKKGRKDKTAKKEKKAKSKGTKGALDSGREAKRPPVQAEQGALDLGPQGTWVSWESGSTGSLTG